MFRNALFVFIFFFISLHAQSKIDLSLGLVNGKTGEHLYTYDTEERVSYLRWQIKNIPIVIVNFSHSFENLEFSLGGKRNIGSKKSGRMRDYDWYTSAEDGVDAKYYGNLSNFSDNYNKIDKLLSIDANAKYWFRHSENFKSAPIIGFKYDEFKFHGYGGIQYNYNPDGTLHSSFSTGDSSGGVEYTQKFKTPYVGYEISYAYEKFQFNLDVKGSVFATANAKDTHLNRNLISDMKFKNIRYISTKAVASYKLSPSLVLNGAFEYSQYFNKKAYRFDVNDDGKIYNDTKLNKTATENRAHVLSIGLSYLF